MNYLDFTTKWLGKEWYKLVMNYVEIDDKVNWNIYYNIEDTLNSVLEDYLEDI